MALEARRSRHLAPTHPTDATSEPPRSHTEAPAGGVPEDERAWERGVAGTVPDCMVWILNGADISVKEVVGGQK